MVFRIMSKTFESEREHLIRIKSSLTFWLNILKYKDPFISSRYDVGILLVYSSQIKQVQHHGQLLIIQRGVKELNFFAFVVFGARNIIS